MAAGRRRPPFIAAAFTCLLAGGVAVHGSGPASAATLLTWDAEVVRVLDGDTFEARIDGDPDIVVVRVAGLNTNETYSEDARDPECHSEAAKTRLDALIGGETVELRARSASSESLGRSLRHVFTGSTNVAAVMLQEGWGLPLMFAEEPDYATSNTDAARVAITSGLRVWDPDACGSSPAASIEMVTHYDASGVDDDNPNGEWVQLRNTGTSSVSLTGWQLRDAGLPRWSFPSGSSIPAGGRIRIYVGVGTNTSTSFYMGHTVSMLSNTADGMFLHDEDFDIRAYDMWPCAGTCGPIDSLIIDAVNFDAPGDDLTNPNGEWFTIRNIGQTVVDLQDWLIETPPYQATSIASRPIAPNGVLTVYMGSGTNTTSKMYLGKSSGILNNAGDKVWISTPARDIADCAAWGNITCPVQALGSRIELTVNWDAAGDDTTNPNGEWVNLTNISTTSLDIGGFKLESPPHSYTVPTGTKIAAGARLRVYVGTGSATATALYWGKSSGFLDNGGDIVRLRDRTGRVVRSFEYPCAGVCGPPPAPFVIDEVRANAAGADATNPNGEWIRIRNVSTRTLDLRDWQILAGTKQLNPTASRTVAPGGVITVYIGPGTNSTTSMYWQQSSGILANEGGDVRLLSPHRDLADCAAWGTGSCPTPVGRAGSIDVTVRYDAAGDDLVNPNGEWVNVSNTGSASIDLTGMQLSTPGHVYTFPSMSLAAGGRVRVFVGSGANSSSLRYWGIDYGVFGNTGDWVSLLDPLGLEIRSFQWPCGGGRCGPIPDLEIDEVIADAPGDDGTNPNGEQVRILNAGSVAVDLRDWSLESSPHVFDFATSAVLDPGDTMTVRIGSGTATSSTRYWGFSSGILNNTGDSVRLVTPAGDAADCAAWGSGSC